MKFEIMRDWLLEGLNDVMKAISQKVANPILTGVKMDVNEKGLTMTGSDSDITICTFIPVEQDGEQIIRVDRIRVDHSSSESLQRNRPEITDKRCYD